MANRKVPEINAGSMADIAFLLLVFFLVTTTIQTDAGLSVLLPPYEENPQEPKKQERRNIFDVQINAADGLLIRSRPGQIADLKDQIKEFIWNPSKREDFSESPDRAIVTLLNDDGTSYEMYVSVYNEVKAAYNELWNEQADRMFGRKYDDLAKENQAKVREIIPLVISEAEPTKFEKK